MSTKLSIAATELSLRSTVARAHRERRTIELRLGDGLQLRAGARVASFSLKFVDRRTGRQERFVLGYYPNIGLAEARRRAREYQARIADPHVLANPARERRATAAMPTFQEIAERRLADERLAATTRDYYRWCLGNYAYRFIAGMAIGDIRADDILSIVDAVAKDAPTTADRVQVAISSVLTWAVSERIITTNPARGIPRRCANIPRDRILNDRELRLLLQDFHCAGVPNVSQDLATILRLLLLTGARSSEVRLAEQSDLRWEGHGPYRSPVWVVPGDRLSKGRVMRGRTKNGRLKILPLSTQAAALFAEVAAKAGARNRLFDIAERRAVSYAMTRCCRRIGLVGAHAATAHDFRRTVATWLADYGERSEVIETILGHAPQSVTRRHYNLSFLLPPVADALQRWANHLDTLMLEESAPHA
jgi:integrase